MGPSEFLLMWTMIHQLVDMTFELSLGVDDTTTVISCGHDIIQLDGRIVILFPLICPTSSKLRICLGVVVREIQVRHDEKNE